MYETVGSIPPDCVKPKKRKLVPNKIIWKKKLNQNIVRMFSTDEIDLGISSISAMKNVALRSTFELSEFA